MRSRGRQAFALVLVGLLVVPGNAAAVVWGSPDLDVSVADNTVTPGSNTQLELTVSNEGDLETGSSEDPSLNEEVTTARGVDVTLEPDGAPVEVTTETRTLGSLPRGEAASLAFGLSVDEDADPGTYELEATVEYEHTSTVAESNGARNRDTVTRHFDVTVEIEDRARFEVVSTSTDARVGSGGTVSVRMRNVGSETANDTAVVLESMNSDVTVGQSASASRYAGDWEPGEARTLEYHVAVAETAEQGSYTFEAVATFEDDDGIAHRSEPISLGVEPGPEQRFRVVDTSSTVAVDETGTLRVTLENAAEAPVTDATVRVESRSGDLAFGDGASTASFVGHWAPGETRTIEYDLTATDGAETRSYALSASVTYEERNGDTGSSDALPFGVTPAPERGFSLSNVSTDMRVGEEGTVRGTITNEGGAVARNVVVRFATENQHLSPLERTYALGDLKPGASAEFAFTVEVSDGADVGPRQFSFVADYRNPDGQARTSDTMLTRQRIAAGGDVFALEPVNASYPAGTSGELTLRVTNTGNETLSSISAKLFADDPISADTEEAFVDELAPGESTLVTLEVSAQSGALATTYPVSIDFQYEDSDGDMHVSDSHQVAVEVTEPDAESGSNGPPIALIGIGAVGVVGVGGYLRFRD